uniref:AAA-type ATPase N-terminal domain-containing protein n=1 Tax=Oryza glaberrima TaxID=4538 RepID=I1Q4W2_ORYGL
MGAPLKLTWASLGSLFATAVLVRTAVRDFLPPEAHGLLRALLSRAAAALVPPCDAIIVHETDANGVPNELYEAAQLYLGARCLATAPAMHLHKTHGAAAAVASLPDSHATLDAFRGVRVLWTSQLDGNASSSFGGSSSSSRGFVHHPFPNGACGSSSGDATATSCATRTSPSFSRRRRRCGPRCGRGSSTPTTPVSTAAAAAAAWTTTRCSGRRTSSRTRPRSTRSPSTRRCATTSERTCSGSCAAASTTRAPAARGSAGTCSTARPAPARPASSPPSPTSSSSTSTTWSSPR